MVVSQRKGRRFKTSWLESRVFQDPFGRKSVEKPGPPLLVQAPSLGSYVKIRNI